MVGLTNAAGERIRGSSRIDGAGNRLSPAAVILLGPVISCLMYQEELVPCKGRGWWWGCRGNTLPLRAAVPLYPGKEGRAAP